ncbi:MAG: glycosyltransferase family 4 protein [bacterium]
MRIALVHGGRTWDVGGHLHLILAEALSGRDHEVFVAALEGNGVAGYAGAMGVEVVELPFPRRPSIMAPRTMRRVLADREAEVVHLCRFEDLWTLSPPPGGRGPDIPALLTVYQRPQAALSRSWYRWLRRRVDRYTAPTPLLRRLAAGAIGGVEEEIELVPHFVDPSLYGAEDIRGRAGEIRRGWGIEAQVPVIGTLAPLRPGCGLETFLEAVRLGAPHLPRARWRIVPWPGTSTGAYAEELAGEARTLENLELAEPEEVTAALFHALDIFVFPVEREGYARSLLQAMASGVPVVAVEGPATSFIIENDRSGLLVQPGDALALAGAAAQILGDPDLRQRLARGGRQRVLSQFSSDVLLPRYEDLYRSLGA